MTGTFVNPEADARQSFIPGKLLRYGSALTTSGTDEFCNTSKSSGIFVQCTMQFCFSFTGSKGAEPQ